MDLLGEQCGVPFYFGFHEGDLYHSLVVGPTGRGMSMPGLIASRSLARQVERKGKVVLIDNESNMGVSKK